VQNLRGAKLFAGFGFLMMVVIAALGCAIVALGMVELIESREFPQPRSISYSDLIRLKPNHGWFEVQGGLLDVRNAAWEETVSTRSIKRAFVPLYDARDGREPKAGVLVETKDPEVLAAIVRSVPDGPGAQMTSRPVQGRVPAFGRSRIISGRMLSQHVDLRPKLKPDFIYLAEGEAPSTGSSLGIIGMGTLVVIMTSVITMKLIKEQRTLAQLRGGITSNR